MFCFKVLNKHIYSFIRIYFLDFIDIILHLSSYSRLSISSMEFYDSLHHIPRDTSCLANIDTVSFEITFCYIIPEDALYCHVYETGRTISKWLKNSFSCFILTSYNVKQKNITLLRINIL